MSIEDEKEAVTLDSLAAMIKAGFDEVHDNFGKVHFKIDQVERTLREDMQLGFASVNRRMDDIAEKLTDHETRITKIEHELIP
jgi:hypothetical protein